MAFDRAEALALPGSSIIIGLSGGADSACLLHHLARIAPRRRIKLSALHIHHGLRGKEADRDAAAAEALAGSLGVPFLLKKADVAALAKKDRRSIEDAARKARYRAFTREAVRISASAVAVGHHLDDQAETLLLHLLRGTKAKGLAGMTPSRTLKGKIRLIRPLLPLTRLETRAYCKAYSLRFRDDSSNDSERFTRNWVRRRLLPLLEKKNPSIRQNLSEIAVDLAKLLKNTKAL